MDVFKLSKFRPTYVKKNGQLAVIQFVVQLWLRRHDSNV